MGLFDFLKKKNKGIEAGELYSLQFQQEACALALWKLEENNSDAREAIKELKKIGLNDEQVEEILDKTRKIIVNKNDRPQAAAANTGAGIDEEKFNSPSFQQQSCALAAWKLEENNGNPDMAIQELKKTGLNDAQVTHILALTQDALARRKNDSSGIDENKFNDAQYRAGILERAQTVYFQHNHSYDAVKQDLLQEGMNERQSGGIISELKQSLAHMVDDFQQKMDSGEISEIKIRPNPEHTKGNVDKDQVDKYIGYGAYQIERGDLDNALELLDKALELDETATLAYANKAVLYGKKGDKATALQLYNKALQYDPGHLQILEQKMELQFEMMTAENEMDFIETVKTILKYDPQSPDALSFLIQFYLKENDLDNALQSLKILFAGYYSEHIVIQLQLDTFARLPKERALKEFALYEKDFGDDAKYQLEYCKGLYLKGVGDYDEAITLYENLNRKHEFSWNYYQMAIMKNLQGKTDECLALLQTTFRLEPELKADAKQFPQLENLWTNPAFLEITK